MKIIVFIIAYLFSLNLLSEEIFLRKNTKKMNINQIPIGHEVNLSAYVHYPEGTKPNLMSVNHLTIYEKNGNSQSDWNLVKKISLLVNGSIPGVNLPINEVLKFKSSNSEIFLDSKVTHCKMDGGCFINYFQKKISRVASESRDSRVDIFPSHEL